MPLIKNKRYLKHFKRGRMELIFPAEFYAKWEQIPKKIFAYKHLTKLLMDYYFLLYWTGRRPSEILELKGSDFRESWAKVEDGSSKECLVIDCSTKKGGKPVEIYLFFDYVPKLREVWSRIQGVPPDFEVFLLLRARDKQVLRWKTKSGEERIKEYSKPIKRLYYWSMKFFDVPPYFFRHNRFSSMADAGDSFEDIKIFKGAKSMASVEPYISPTAAKMKSLGAKLKYTL